MDQARKPTTSDGQPHSTVLPASAIQLPSHMQQELQAMEQRAMRLRKGGTRLSILAMGMALANFVLMGLAAWLAPDTTISRLHIPEEALQMFSDAVNVEGGTTRTFGSPTLAVTTLVSSLLPVLRVISIVVVCITGVLYFVLPRRDSSWGAMWLGAMMIAFGTIMVDVVITGGGKNPLQPSERQTFVRFMESKDYATVQHALEKSNLPAVLQDYLLAQAGAMDPHKREGTVGNADAKAANDTLAEKVRRIDAAISDGAGPKLDGRVLSVLETQFLGGIQSAPAKAYVNDANANSALARTAKAFAAIAAIGLFGALGVVGVLGRSLRSRIARIRPLLGHAGAEKEEGV